jgi:hypothetical protein
LDGRTAWSSRGGVRIDDPINMVDQSELDEFGKLFCSADFGAKSGLLIEPPLFRRMMKEGELKVVPHVAIPLPGMHAPMPLAARTRIDHEINVQSSPRIWTFCQYRKTML